MFGHTLLEAMTYDLPVVAVDSAAIPEIAGDAALYFDPENPDELTNKLETVLLDDETVAQLIGAGKTRLEHFSWDKNVQQLVETFEEQKRR
jgi:glycosyltransferase involved in cell wall biosynthesis